MTYSERRLCECRPNKWLTLEAVRAVFAWLLLAAVAAVAQPQNLLKNPGFEDPASGGDTIPNWTTSADSLGRASLSDQGTHAGQRSMVIPAHGSVEQKIDPAVAGAYVARFWVKSGTAQTVTLLLQDTNRPWAAYSCTEIKLPANQWVKAEAFCALDRSGSLTLTVGGMSKDFRFYHGVSGEMTTPILVDDFELIRYESKPAAERAAVKVSVANKDLTPNAFAGSPVLASSHLVAAVREKDGAVIISSVQASGLKPRCAIVPSVDMSAPRCTLVETNGRKGIRVASGAGNRSYVAWLTPNGLITIEANQVPQFQVQDCRLRYGLLPSFAGTDICYSPQKLSGKQVCLPSTQWFVGLVDGCDSMLVAVWESASQAVSLGLSGEGEQRLMDSLAIATDQHGFSLSFVEHPGLWHQEPLKEDWLGEYISIGWERPFPARWMSHFFVSPGGEPSFREPYMGYSFPIADAKSRMWGVWFEDWNHYPFFFDGQRTVFHFEKTFVPQGDALIYFLEPAAADLLSPCEIVEQALGRERAEALFDLDANQIRKLKYSTPNQFMYDRPVCATTTRLSKIKQGEKATVGVNLATHLYEFIREIRGRVDQYGAFFGQVKGYLDGQAKAHPELRDYITELEGLVTNAQSKSEEIYATQLGSVEKKTDAMKKLLVEGKGDGFDCGNLDVRGPAGAQDDLCRRYNRVVMRLMQTAALKCGNSPGKAVIAKYVWDQSRAVLQQPTRWESRRTLYFFEP
jgi:hypothetical protein